jgi:Fe-S cluster biogenesis protein NfuA
MSRTNEEIENEIKEILKSHVEPYVAQHGGEVRFVGYSDGVVLLEMSGACSGCAGSSATLEHGIRNLLTHLVPEVEEVQGMDDPYSSIEPYLMNPYYYDDIIEILNQDYDVDPDKE